MFVLFRLQNLIIVVIFLSHLGFVILLVLSFN